MAKPGTADDFVTAVLNATRPVSYLVGSPLVQPTSPGGPGVPGVRAFAEMALTYLRALLGGAGSADAELSRLIAAGTGATDTYQAVLDAIALVGNQDHIARVVQRAVLCARNPGDALVGQPLADIEADTAGWWLSPGVAALGQILVRPGPRRLGTVLTSNFDPLVEVAVHRAGGQAVSICLDEDGAPRIVPKTAGAVRVVHLHGFWRETDTLHSPDQLAAPRPKLTEYIRNLLATDQLAVLAYGGWDDVFTRTMSVVSAVSAGSAHVMWCVRDNTPGAATLCPASMRGKCEELEQHRRLMFYGGVDCHSVLPALEAKLPTVSPPPAGGAGPTGFAAPTGWETIDAPGLAGRRHALSPEDLALYLDGDQPRWQLVLDSRIGRRGIVETLVAHVSARLGAAAPHGLLLVGPGGEGKTTALLQAACELLARTPDARILWRNDPVSRLPSGTLQALEPGTWFIVADAAENIAADVQHQLVGPNPRAGAHVFFLLAARDTDWRAYRAERLKWGPRYAEFLIPRLSMLDAKVVAEAWAAAGARGLGALADETDLSVRCQRLYDAAKQLTDARESGSLLGASLRLRFTPEGLRDRVASILDRHLQAGGSDALARFGGLAHVFAADAIGLQGCDRALLCEAIGLDEKSLRASVILPLAGEIHLARSGEIVRSRHIDIARAGVYVLEARFAHELDLKDVYSAITRIASKSISAATFPARDALVAAAHSGPKIARVLREVSLGVEPDRVAEIAVAAAGSAAAADPTYLGLRVTVARTHRELSDLPNARSTLTAALDMLFRFRDRDENERGAWLELAVVLGDLAHLLTENVALCAIAVSDQAGRAPPSIETAKLALAAMGKAFQLLIAEHPDRPWRSALRAVSQLGPVVARDKRTLKYFADYARVAQRKGTPLAPDRKTAFAWMRAGVELAEQRVVDPWVRSRLDGAMYSLRGMRRVLEIPM